MCFGVPQHYAERLQREHIPQSLATIFAQPMDIDFISGISVHLRSNEIFVTGSILTFLEVTHALHFNADRRATEADLP